MTPDHAYELAGDLVRELGPLHGDTEAIDAICLRWLAVLGARDFGLINAAALRFVFADCLSTVPPPSQVPPGAVAFTRAQGA